MNKDRILAISKKLGLSHVGSNLSCLPILEEIYRIKQPDDLVFLSGAHAHLAHLIVKVNDAEVESLIKRYGIHCDRHAGCDFSGGSLGHLGIALGYALARADIVVYAIITDGSFCEGSELEALRIAKTLGVKNLVIHANFNTYTATEKVDVDYFERIIKGIGYPVQIHRTYNGEGFDSVEGHYRKL